jgi:predicted metal-dependent hydrolase
MDPLDPAARRRLMEAGRDAFNRGEFFEAHEFWEEVWDVIDDPERTWIQGMIQVATGLHKLQRHRSDVCATLLRKALAKLVDCPDRLDGFDLAGMRGDATRLLDEIDAGGLPTATGIRLR